MILLELDSEVGHYHTQIKKIKEKGPVDFIKFEMDGHSVSLRLVENSEETIKLLLEWRTKFWNYFDTKFNGNHEKTLFWVNEKILKNPNRILFLIILNGEKIGHIGTDHYDEKTNSAQIQNVMHGLKNNHPPKLMENVLNSMFRWMFDDLKLSMVQLKVFSESYKAINLYERCKMLTVGSIPLQRITTEGGWKWEETSIKNEDEYPNRWFNVMEISRNSFYE